MDDRTVPKRPGAAENRPRGNAADTESNAQVAAPPGFHEAMAVVTRVISARVDDPHERQDIEQETAIRLLERSPALDPQAAIAYGIVTARNLIVSRGRHATVAGRALSRLIDLREPGDPLDYAVVDEERAAVLAALAALAPADRESLIAHEVDEIPLTDMARRGSRTAGSVAVSLAAARARLRVQFLLEHRQITLPTTRCRSVLDALSANDARRSQQVRADEHLAGCRTCSALAEPLLRRRRREPLVLLPFVAIPAVFAKVRQLVRSHPVTTAVVAVGAAAAIVVVLATDHTSTVTAPPPPPSSAVSATTTNPPTSVEPAPSAPPIESSVPPTSRPANAAQTLSDNPSPVLQVDDAPMLPRSPASLGPFNGQTVQAKRVIVLAVPNARGFWVGTDNNNRVWVHFDNPGQVPRPIEVGQHLTFAGTLTTHPSGYATRIGIKDPIDAAQLEADGAHITATATSLIIE